MPKPSSGQGPKRLGKSARAVVDLIELKPTITADGLSRDLGVSVQAIKKRIQRLLRSGVISSLLVVAPEFRQLTAKAFVSITFAHSSLKNRKKRLYRDLREFTRFLGDGLPATREWVRFFSSRDPSSVVVKEAYSVAGGGLGTDVVVLVEGKTDILVREFVTDVLGQLEGVLETNTAAIAYVGT